MKTNLKATNAEIRSEVSWTHNIWLHPLHEGVNSINTNFCKEICYTFGRPNMPLPWDYFIYLLLKIQSVGMILFFTCPSDSISRGPLDHQVDFSVSSWFLQKLRSIHVPWIKAKDEKWLWCPCYQIFYSMLHLCFHLNQGMKNKK